MGGRGDRKHQLEPCWFRDTEVAADFSSKVVVDFGMPWNGAALAGLCVTPPRMTAAFAQQLAVISLKVRNKIAPFHTATSNAS
jgi:hypothetical protein